jgi:hypothetical protein
VEVSTITQVKPGMLTIMKRFRHGIKPYDFDIKIGTYPQVAHMPGKMIHYYGSLLWHRLGTGCWAEKKHNQEQRSGDKQSFHKLSKWWGKKIILQGQDRNGGFDFGETITFALP